MNSLNDIWNSVLAVLGQNLTATALNTWFDDCTPVEIVNNRLVIHTPTEFKRDIIQSRFAQTIIDALSDLFSAEFKLTILAGDELDSYISETKTDDTLPEVAGFTFDNFVVGPSNKYAHAAAIAVAENPGKLYNPLFIYGNSGLGKTHLLLAIGSAIHAKNPKAKIVYVKGDDFTNDLVHAIQVGGGEDLRAKYRSADLLLMDDIQFIAGKQQTQEEFFHTFNTLYEAGKQIVVTSDRPPMEMNKLEDRIRTRLEWGLMADVQPPDLETRMAITRNKAAQFGVVLPDDVVTFIGETVTSNIRQLEGVVKKLTAYRDLLEDDITVSSVRRAKTASAATSARAVTRRRVATRKAGWRPSVSRSVIATGSSRAISSAQSPTRPAWKAVSSAASTSMTNIRCWTCRPTCPRTCSPICRRSGWLASS